MYQVPQYPAHFLFGGFQDNYVSHIYIYVYIFSTFTFTFTFTQGGFQIPPAWYDPPSWVSTEFPRNIVIWYQARALIGLFFSRRCCVNAPPQNWSFSTNLSTPNLLGVHT